MYKGAKEATDLVVSNGEDVSMSCIAHKWAKRLIKSRRLLGIIL